MKYTKPSLRRLTRAAPGWQKTARNAAGSALVIDGNNATNLFSLFPIRLCIRNPASRVPLCSEFKSHGNCCSDASRRMSTEMEFGDGKKLRAECEETLHSKSRAESPSRRPPPLSAPTLVERASAVAANENSSLKYFSSAKRIPIKSPISV